MKRLCSIALVLVFTILCISTEKSAFRLADGGAGVLQCTSACLNNNGFAVLAANYDSGWDKGLIYVNKRGVKKSNRYMDPNYPSERVIEWTSKYASITAACFAYQHPWCGMNEQGLAFSTMALAWHYAPDDDRAYMDGNYWWQYILDTCATIEDIRTTDVLIRINTVDHYLVTDRYANAAVIEFNDGGMTVHAGEGLPVAALTNTDYRTSYQAWDPIKHTSGAYSNLSDSLQRFCITADLVDTFNSTTDEAAITYAYDVLDAATLGLPSKGQWSIVFDTKNMRAYFRTRNNPAIRYADLYDFDFSCKSTVNMLDIDEGLGGDVSADFYPIDFNLSIERALAFMEWYAEAVNEEQVNRVIDEIMGFACDEKKSDKNIDIPADSTSIAAGLRCALNPLSGEVLVVWSESDPSDPSLGRVRSAMLFRTLEGAYSAAELHVLSLDGCYNARPFPVFLGDRGCFLVVWDQADPATPGAKSYVQGRIVSGRGLPEGELLTLVAGKRRNESPHVYCRASAVKAPAGMKAEAKIDLVFFSAKAGKAGLSQPALHMVGLDNNFKAGKPRVLMQGGMKQVNGNTIAEKLLPVGGGQVVGENIIMPIEHLTAQDDGSLLSRPKVLVIDGSDSLVDVEGLGNAGARGAKLATLSPPNGRTMVIGSTLLNGAVTNDVFLASASGRSLLLDHSFTSVEPLRAVDSLFLVTSPSSPSGQALQPGDDAAGYQLLATSRGIIYQREISAGGSASGPYSKVVSKLNGIASLAGLEITLAGGSGRPAAGEDTEFLIAWPMAGKGGYEIRAYVFKAR